MINESEKEDLILCYFSILDELYDWNFNSYDVVIQDEPYRKGVKELHENILKTLILKDNSNIPSKIQKLLAQNLLVIKSNRYSTTRKTHWNDIIEIQEELKDRYKALSAKLLNELDSSISNIIKEESNLIVLNLINMRVPLENLKMLYEKEINTLINAGLTDGEKIIRFHDSHYLYYKFNDGIQKEEVIKLVKDEKVKLFSSCNSIEKEIISILQREKIIINKGIDYYPVTKQTETIWEQKLNGILVNFDEKITECTKITNHEPFKVKQIIDQLKLRGLIWEYKNYIYSVVYEIVLGMLPIPPDDFSRDIYKNVGSEVTPKESSEGNHSSLEMKVKGVKKEVINPYSNIDFIISIKNYIQGFCKATKFTESPTKKKVEKLLFLLEKDLQKYGWSEESNMLEVITNEFELIIDAEKINNSKWRKLGKLFLGGLSSLLN